MLAVIHIVLYRIQLKLSLNTVVVKLMFLIMCNNNTKQVKEILLPVTIFPLESVTEITVSVTGFPLASEIKFQLMLKIKT